MKLREGWMPQYLLLLKMNPTWIYNRLSFYAHWQRILIALIAILDVGV